MFGPAVLKAALLSALAISANALTMGGKPSQMIKPYKRAPLQDIVTWDEHSLFVHGERIIFYSGEFHPYRSVSLRRQHQLQDLLPTQTSRSRSVVGHSPKDQGSRLHWCQLLHRLGSA